MPHGDIDILRLLRLILHRNAHVVKLRRNRLNLPDNLRELLADMLDIFRAAPDGSDELIHLSHAGRNGMLHFAHHVADVQRRQGGLIR